MKVIDVSIEKIHVSERRNALNDDPRHPGKHIRAGHQAHKPLDHAHGLNGEEK